MEPPTYEQLLASAPSNLIGDERHEFAAEAWILIVMSSRSPTDPSSIKSTSGCMDWKDEALKRVKRGRAQNYSPVLDLERVPSPELPVQHIDEPGEDSVVTYTWMEEYLSSLGEEDVRIFTWYSEGLSQYEIAERIGITQAAVSYRLGAITKRARLFREVTEARERLREALPTLNLPPVARQELELLLEQGSVVMVLKQTGKSGLSLSLSMGRQSRLSETQKLDLKTIMKWGASVSKEDGRGAWWSRDRPR